MYRRKKYAKLLWAMICEITNILLDNYCSFVPENGVIINFFLAKTCTNKRGHFTFVTSFD